MGSITSEIHVVSRILKSASDNFRFVTKHSSSELIITKIFYGMSLLGKAREAFELFLSRWPSTCQIIWQVSVTIRKAIGFIIYQDARGGITKPELPVNKTTKSFDCAV